MFLYHMVKDDNFLAFLWNNGIISFIADYKNTVHSAAKIFILAVDPTIILVYEKSFYGNTHTLDIIRGSNWLEMAFRKAILLLTIYIALLYLPIRHMLTEYP